MSDLRDGSVAVQVFLSVETYQRLLVDATREGRRPYQQAAVALDRLYAAPPSEPAASPTKRRRRSTPTT
jgi:hypothetical protein